MKKVKKPRKKEKQRRRRRRRKRRRRRNDFKTSTDTNGKSNKKWLQAQNSKLVLGVIDYKVRNEKNEKKKKETEINLKIYIYFTVALKK